MQVFYTAAFIRMLAKLPGALQEEALEKIELFRLEKNHTRLKVHKLTGALHGRWSFSVNYKTRIVFVYRKSKPVSALCHAIGDHDIYD